MKKLDSLRQLQFKKEAEIGVTQKERETTLSNVKRIRETIGTHKDIPLSETQKKIFKVIGRD